MLLCVCTVLSGMRENSYQNLNALLHHQRGIIGGFAHSHYSSDTIFFQFLWNKPNHKRQKTV